MNAMQRIVLACRAAVAEVNPIIYLVPTGILIVMTVLLVLVNGDADGDSGQLRSVLSFWDPAAIQGLIVFSGWIGGLVVSSKFHGLWFKEEQQAVRTLSLPLSNGERFLTALILHLVLVPLVSFGLPLLLLIILSPLAPETVFLPSPIYFWRALGAGLLVNLVTCALWLQPTYAFGKKSGLLLLLMICVGFFYAHSTHGDMSETLDVPYVAAAVQESQAVGLANYGLLDNTVPTDKIKIRYPGEGNVYHLVQLVFLLLMVASAGLALTKKTA